MKELENTLKGKTILIVEDELIAHKYFEAVLLPLGAKIISAFNGVEAVIRYKENPGIDVVLMDIRMPKMDGYQALNELLKINPDVVAIAQTACALPYERQVCISAGFMGYLSKPINKILLIKTLGECVFIDC